MPPNPKVLKPWNEGMASHLENKWFVFSYLWNFLSLDSRPYLFRIMTTEKYKSETAAARILITTIWRKLVFKIRGHPTGEMLKCQEAGKRQEMPSLKFQKTQNKTDFKAICSKEDSLHLTWSKTRHSVWAALTSLLIGICIPAPSILLLCYITHYGHVLHKDVPVNDGLPIWQWSHKMIMKLKDSHHLMMTQCNNSLLTFVVMLVWTNLCCQSYKSEAHTFMHST